MLIICVDFCNDKTVHDKVTAAYLHLWDLIEANKGQLNNELWSWTYSGTGFKAVPFSTYSTTEGNAQQLWSLAFLAVKKEKK
jgi:hypothetical protein